MKNFAPYILCLLSALSNAANACSELESGRVPADSLSVTASSFSVSETDGRRLLTTLGSMKNVSSTCFDSVVVEVKYFDAKNNHVDTITQPLYGVVASPSNEVAFRVRDEAAHAKEVYSSQVIRFVSAEPRKAPRTAAKTPSFQSSLGDFLVSWGPLLLLIGVWIFYMQRMKSKDSPQGKLVTLYEKQVEILETQNTTFDRIANALEARTSESENA